MGLDLSQVEGKQACLEPGGFQQERKDFLGPPCFTEDSILSG